MKKNLQAVLFCLLAILNLTGCIREDCSCTMELNTEIFEMRSNTWWEWNPAMERYECFFDFPGLTQDIIDMSLSQAYVYVLENVEGRSVEFTKPLPFVQTFREDGSNITYTETISYDTEPGAITFFMQTSDLMYAQEFLPPAYLFKFSWVVN